VTIKKDVADSRNYHVIKFDHNYNQEDLKMIKISNELYVLHVYKYIKNRL